MDVCHVLVQVQISHLTVMLLEMRSMSSAAKGVCAACIALCARATHPVQRMAMSVKMQQPIRHQVVMC